MTREINPNSNHNISNDFEQNIIHLCSTRNIMFIVFEYKLIVKLRINEFVAN